MRVLITGGAGFVGSHLADACLLRGDEVYVLDDLSTGSIDNIEYLKRHPYFHYTIGRVQNAQVTAELVDRVDMVYHLAAEQASISEVGADEAGAAGDENAHL